MSMQYRCVDIKICKDTLNARDDEITQQLPLELQMEFPAVLTQRSGKFISPLHSEICWTRKIPKNYSRATPFTARSLRTSVLVAQELQKKPCISRKRLCFTPFLFLLLRISPAVLVMSLLVHIYVQSTPPSWKFCNQKWTSIWCFMEQCWRVIIVSNLQSIWLKLRMVVPWAPYIQWQMNTKRLCSRRINFNF